MMVAYFLLSSLLLSRLEFCGTQVYEPQIRARLGTAAHFCDDSVRQHLGVEALGGDGFTITNIKNKLTDLWGIDFCKTTSKTLCVG